jgi:methylated-DNA-[protein]-cysteine S-methyltransferase
MNFFKTSYQSPLGTLQITCSEEALCGLRFMDEGEPAGGTNKNEITQIAVQQLDEYFKGERKLFQMPILQNGTSFQTKIWSLLQDIPYGRTLSYMDLSKRFGDVKAIRAVAAANGKNNIAIIVPCHRVIGSNQSLTGYAGGLWRKQWLLAHEAKFNNGVQELF